MVWAINGGSYEDSWGKAVAMVAISGGACARGGNGGAVLQQLNSGAARRPAPHPPLQRVPRAAAVCALPAHPPAALLMFGVTVLRFGTRLKLLFDFVSLTYALTTAASYHSSSHMYKFTLYW